MRESKFVASASAAEMAATDKKTVNAIIIFKNMPFSLSIGYHTSKRMARLFCLFLLISAFLTDNKDMHYQEAFATIKEFYDHAWGQMVLILTIGFGIIGVIMPVVYGILHYQISKGSISRLKKRLEEYTQRFKSLENEVKEAMGGIYFMQGNMQIREDPSLSVQAFESFLKALLCFLEIDIEEHITTAEDCLYDISDRFNLLEDPLLPNIKEVIETAVNKLRKKNKRKRYSDFIFFLEEILKKSDKK